MIGALLAILVVLGVYYLFFKNGGKHAHVPTVSVLDRVLWGSKMQFLLSEAAYKHHSDFVYLSFIVRKTLVGTHPDVAKAILQGDNTVFHKGTLAVNNFNRMINDSVVFANDPVWKMQRSSMNSAFHFDYLVTLMPVFISKIEHMFSLWKVDQVIDVLPWVKKLTIDIIGTSALAQDFDTLGAEKRNPYCEAYDQAFGSLGILGMIIPKYRSLPIEQNRKLLNSTDALIRLTKEHIAKRREENKHECLLDMMINSDMNEAELINNVFLFFMAGHETTATSLSWALYYLAKYTDVQEKLRSEVLSVMGKTAIPTLEDMKKMPYLDMVIKEVLRIRPPAAQVMGRKTTEAMQLGSLFLPAETSVSINIYAIHHHPDFWTDPEKFDPERFSSENSQGRHPYAYLPFSLGKRHCIGQNFSLMEQRAFLVMFMQRYSVEYAQKDPVLTDNFTLTIPKEVIVKVCTRA